MGFWDDEDSDDGGGMPEDEQIVGLFVNFYLLVYFYSCSPIQGVFSDLFASPVFSLCYPETASHHETTLF